MSEQDKKHEKLDQLYDELDKVLFSNVEDKQNKLDDLREKIKLVKNDPDWEKKLGN